MLKICVSNLSGGQGKTTLSYLLAKSLVNRGWRVLAVDSDPQHSLTTFLDKDVESDAVTLLEVLKGRPPIEAIVPVDDRLSLLPCDDGLIEAQDYLNRQLMPVAGLRKALAGIEGYDAIVIDTPTRCVHLPAAAIASADLVIVPAECASKGLFALSETIEAINELRGYGQFLGELLGIVPFRARWVGHYPTKITRESLEAFLSLAESTQTNLFPSIVESEGYKLALDKGILPTAETMTAVEQIIDQIEVRYGRN